MSKIQLKPMMLIITHHTRQKFRDRGLIALTIVCLPCICVVGTCILLSHAFYSLSNYELPSTKRKRWLEYEERERRRRTPWVLAPRAERDVDALSILGDDKVEIEDVERGDEVEKAKVWRITDWQENSAFFNLPLEIRKQIYEEAIGGYTLHIFTLDSYRRMSHTRCKGESPTPVSCQCPLLSRQPGVADEWGNICLLSLVMSCRRM